MDILLAISDIIDFIAPTNTESVTDRMTDAQIEEEHIKRESDRGAEMEYIMENEKDELLRKKLEWRLNSGIYQWEDLYNN